MSYFFSSAALVKGSFNARNIAANLVNTRNFMVFRRFLSFGILIRSFRSVVIIRSCICIFVRLSGLVIISMSRILDTGVIFFVADQTFVTGFVRITSAVKLSLLFARLFCVLVVYRVTGIIDSVTVVVSLGSVVFRVSLINVTGIGISRILVGIVINTFVFTARNSKNKN